MEQKTLHIIEKIIIFVFISTLFFFAYQSTYNWLVESGKNILEFRTIISFIFTFIFNIPITFISSAYRSFSSFIFLSLALIYVITRVNFVLKIKKNEQIKDLKDKDIRYYRDIFNKISPSIISLIEDYNIDLSRDLSAVTLKLSKDGYLNITDYTIEVLDKDTSSLRKSERMVIELYQGKNKMSFFTRGDYFSEYEKQIIKEAIDDGYIKQDIKIEKDKDLFLILSLTLIFGFLIYIKSLLMFLIPLIIIPIIYRNIKKMGFYLLIQVLGFFICASLALITMVYNVFLTIYFVISSVFILTVLIPITLIMMWIGGSLDFTNKRMKFKRTDKGNQLHYNIMGLKRFMNDFSHLDKSSIKELVLWDYYLIYSIVLNVNKKAYKSLSLIINKYLKIGKEDFI